MAEKKNEKGLTFEKALERLETIVTEMEGGQLGLEDLVRAFEEGTALVKFCTEKLNEVEKKIEKLTAKGDEVVAEPLEEAGEEPAP